MTSREALLARFQAGDAHVGVVGLGYVGLPLAVVLAEAGHTVTGVDVDEARVSGINEGQSHIADIGAERVASLVESGRLRAAISFDDLSAAHAVIIAVPTPIDIYGVPILQHVRSALEAVSGTIGRGCLVVLESTTYPGTTDEIVLPALLAHGLRVDEDVFVGYSPERIDPGNERWSITSTPKLVSGVTPASLELCSALYASFVDTVVPVSTVRTAELAKLFENIYRVVNIALVNELQVICDSFEIDIWELLAACSTKPYGFTPFYPGPGLGGHCVPVDPFYLAWKARERGVPTEFIELAGKVNAAMPAYVVRKLAGMLNRQVGLALKGARIGLIGVTYKRNSADLRESPALRVHSLLVNEGADISYHDPHVDTIDNVGERLTSVSLSADWLASRDAVVILTDHDAIDWALVKEHATLVLDTRNALNRGGR